MENKFNFNTFGKEEIIPPKKYNINQKSNFNPNQNKDNIFTKNINFNLNPNIKNNINKQNIIKCDINKKQNIEPVFPESNNSNNIYQENISLLKEKIKEQENDILYLNDRLKNYDISLEEITKLNVEINKLNEVIREKNYTIQEYRSITELSKKKFDELIKNKNQLVNKIKILEKENRDLKSNINNFDSNFTNMKIDLNDIIKENKNLKRELYEKNVKINKMNALLEKSNINPIKNNINFDDINYNKGNTKNFPENLYIKDTSNILSNINSYIVNNNNYNNLKSRSRTPLVNDINKEESNIPNQRLNFYDQEYPLRTEPNNNVFNDLKNKYGY